MCVILIEADDGMIGWDVDLIYQHFFQGVHGFSGGGNAAYYYIRNVEFNDYRLYIGKGKRLGLTKEYGNGM